MLHIKGWHVVVVNTVKSFLLNFSLYSLQPHATLDMQYFHENQMFRFQYLKPVLCHFNQRRCSNVHALHERSQ